MRALTAQSYAKPVLDLAVSELPIPKITSPNDVIIKVHAASLNPADTKIVSGDFKPFGTVEFPRTLGYDLSGTIHEVGEAVKNFKINDEVYCMVGLAEMGTVAEYVKTSAEYVAAKPPTLSYAEAASLPATALTAIQALDFADKSIEGGLKGKRVFVPAGLSGTGCIALQLLKNVFGAAHVITSVSTSKLASLHDLVGTGVVDQVVDYTKEDVFKEIPRGSIDFLFDTIGLSWSYLSLVKPKTGHIVTIAMIPSGKQMEPQFPDAPWWIMRCLDLVHGFYEWRARRWEVGYHHWICSPNSSDLRRISEWVAEKKLKPVVGRVAKLEDISEIKAICEQLYTGKGASGKFVIEI